MVKRYSYAPTTRFMNYIITGDGFVDPKRRNTVFPVRCDCGREYLFTKQQLQEKISKQSRNCRHCKPPIGVEKKPLNFHPERIQPILSNAFLSGKL